MIHHLPLAARAASFRPTLRRLHRTICLAFTVAVAACFVPGGAARASLPTLQNGSFETNGGNLSTVVSSWTLSGGGVLVYNGYGTTDGSYALVFNGGGR